MRLRNLYPTKTPLFIDNRKDVVAGYSLRLMKTGYTGGLLRIRRSSDNAEMDIFADSTGFASWPVISNFIGVGTASASRFYDQSGNARHLLQATALLQPRVNFLSNGRAGLLFDGVDDTMNTATGFVVAQPDSFNVCYRQVAVLQPSLQNVFDSSITADQQTLYNASNGGWQNRLYAGSPGGIIDAGVSMPVGTRGTVGGQYNTTSSLLAVNAATIATLSDAVTVGSNSQNGLTLGMRLATGSRADNIEVQEFIWYSTGHTLFQLKTDNAVMRQAWNF